MPDKETLCLKPKAVKQRHKWTEEELEVVRRDYRGTNASAQIIADRLGITKWAVKGQAAKMGILQQKSPDWTPEELERLQTLIHQYPVTRIAKILRRSTNAVKVKATRLKLQLRVRKGWYTKREVCEILGVDHKKVQFWIDMGNLEATWHNGRRPSQKGSAMWHITANALRKFIILHSEKLLGRNVDIQQIVWLLVGEGVEEMGTGNKEWGYRGKEQLRYLNTVATKERPRPRNGQCAHEYEIDGSGHGFCKFCPREVQFDPTGQSKMQVIKEGMARN